MPNFLALTLNTPHHTIATVSSPKMANAMLKLPDELLLAIALELDPLAIKCFSLTCRRLRPVAREALIRSTAPVVLYNVWVLFDELQQYDLGHKISHLCLGSSVRGTVSDHAEDYFRDTVLEGGMQKCCDIIINTTKSARLGECGAWIEALQHAFRCRGWPCGWPNAVTVLGMSLLFAVTPHLHTLTLPLTTTCNYDLLSSLFYKPTPQICPWQPQVHRILKERIEVLEITKDIPITLSSVSLVPGQATAQHVMFVAFEHLRRLVVPLYLLAIEPHGGVLRDAVFFNTIQVADPYKMLPPTLEVLRFEDCDNGGYGWNHGWLGTAFVQTLVQSSYFKKLQLLQLVFEEFSIPLAQRISSAHIRDFRRWQASTQPRVEMLFWEWEIHQLYPRRTLSDEYVVEDLAQMMEACQMSLSGYIGDNRACRRLLTWMDATDIWEAVTFGDNVL